MNWKIVLAGSIALGFLDLGELSVVQKAVAGDTVALSAATKKKKTATRRQEPNQVACTELGCHPIPPGCHPQMGYNWDGIPTGFVSRRESAKVWGEFPPLSGVKSGKDVPPDDQSRSSHPDRPVACRSA